VGAQGALGKLQQGGAPKGVAVEVNAAAGAVGLTGRESEILRASIKYSLGMLAYVCVWVFLLSLVR
jgi:lactate permease